MSEVTCYHCNKIGHYKRDCRALKRENAASTHDKKDRPDQEATQDGGFIVMTATTSKTEKSVNEWIFDSGASFHLTPKITLIEEYHPLKQQIPITVGNNETVYAIGEGFVKLVSKVKDELIPIKLTGVHYVPEASENLFSQGAADAKGLKFLSENGQLNIIKNKKTLIIGQKIGANIYKLKLEAKAKINVAMVERTLDEWHRALGHPDKREIIKMASEGRADGLKIVTTNPKSDGCAECVASKAHKVSHPVSERERAIESLQRVHGDLVGPVTPASLTGHRYFYLSKDEFNYYMFVYFLADKSQVATATKRFFNEAAALTQHHVSILRTDNGSEFKNSAMDWLCMSEGTTQGFSAPYNAEQNGKIERANQTIIETARAMMQNAALPQTLWAEAVKTEVYLRNRISSKRTHNKTPFEMFHGKIPVISYLIEYKTQAHILKHTRDKKA